jgi:hypothetical protein
MVYSLNRLYINGLYIRVAQLGNGHVHWQLGHNLIVSVIPITHNIILRWGPNTNIRLLHQTFVCLFLERRYNGSSVLVETANGNQRKYTTGYNIQVGAIFNLLSGRDFRRYVRESQLSVNIFFDGDLTAIGNHNGNGGLVTTTLKVKNISF